MNKKNYITWLYFLKEKEEVVFLYGISLPTISNCQESNIDKRSSIRINKNQSIVCFKTISNKTLEKDNLLCFNGFIKDETYEVEILKVKNIILLSDEINRNIPRSILGTPLKTKVFYTKHIYEYLNNKNIENLKLLFEKLEKVTAQPFSKSYIKRIGCYEIGEPNEWLENTNTPFILEQNLDREKNKREYFFEKKSNFFNKKYLIHLIIYNSEDEVIFDTIKSINEEDIKITLCDSVMDEDSSFEYWVFDKNNILIDRQKFSFLKSVNINMGILGGSYKLPKESFSKKSPLSKEDSIVSTINYNMMQIDMSKDSNIELENKKLYAKVKEFSQKDEIKDFGKWFTKDKYKEIIEFLNEITKNGSYKLIFIDPFISSTASLDYLYHFSNTQISLQFISCWAKNISPDNDKKEESEIEHIEIFKKRLDDIKNYQIPLKSAIWYNLKEKEFHDRFIYVENTITSEINVYTLSNSLNNMLTIYNNLSIVPLRGNVLVGSISYIQELINKCNDNNKIYPKD